MRAWPLACVLLFASAAPARAEDETRADVTAAPDAPWSPPPAMAWPPTSSSRAEDGTYVPPLGDPRRRGPDAALAPPPATALRASRLFLQIVPVVLLPLRGSYDRRLAERGYSTDEIISGLDLGGAARVNTWLWLGGRTGLRYRSFGDLRGASASASGQDFLFTADARGMLGTVIDYWGQVGVGLAVAWTTMRDVFTTTVSPRVNAAAGFGVNFLSNWRVIGRVSFEWYPLFDVNDLGDDTSLGGLGFGVGIEWRK